VPLPGYKPAHPMVFSGIYTADGAKYPDLRDALEKLKLNDARSATSRNHPSRSASASGVAFWAFCTWRSSRSGWSANTTSTLITTAPSVVYRVTKTDGQVVMVDNPLNYPDPALIELAEEPFVKAGIICPPEYVGNIMELCQDRRGEYKELSYLDASRVELRYELPLNEIIYDFFDALKSRSRGYASLDYEFSGYRPSELVKLDILLNGEVVDALSFIVH
jgi:GTP-binding protein LepA